MEHPRPREGHQGRVTGRNEQNGETMQLEFSGKRVLVAGGSRGIGRSIALGFAAAGADVAICARSADALEKARQEIAEHGHKAHAASCDLADGPAANRGRQPRRSRVPRPGTAPTRGMSAASYAL